MALTAAEKQRRFRARRDQDPEKRARHLAKRREKYRKEVNDGVRPSMASLSERQKRALRKKWRKDKRDLRQRQKLAALTLNTPPSTPGNVSPLVQSPTHHSPSRCLSSQKMQSLKKASQEREKYKKEVFQLRKQLNSTEKNQKCGENGGSENRKK